MTKQFEMEAMERMVQVLTKTVTDAICQQTKTIKEMFDKRIDSLEHSLFTANEKVEKVEKENELLKEEIKKQREAFDSLEKKVGENRALLIEERQEKLRTDLIIIRQPDAAQFDIPLGKLDGTPTQRQNLKGESISYYKFKDIRDKIDILKEKAELRKKKITVFSPLCAEMKALRDSANSLLEKGRVTKVWFHRDRLYAQHTNGDRYQIKSEVDIDFLDS